MQLLTMTDLRFLPPTLALHRSLIAHAKRFNLTVLCMDEPSWSFLAGRRLTSVEPVALAELERADPALASTRPKRSWREYCWTATPAFVHHRLQRSPANGVVGWIDAEVEFFRDPAALSQELGEGSILLTPHRYRRIYPWAASGAELTARYGPFNGGTVVLRADAQGLAAAALWRERSLAWCYDRCQPGRFGNQMHLADFPERFSGARVMNVPGGVLGPWVGGQFAISTTADGPTADGRPVYAYHYESLWLEGASPWVGQQLMPNTFGVSRSSPALQARANAHYRLSAGERRLWRRYARGLAPAIRALLASYPRYATTFAPQPSREDVLADVRVRLKNDGTTACWARGLDRCLDVLDL
jgi:hypothetical protein